MNESGPVEIQPTATRLFRALFSNLSNHSSRTKLAQGSAAVLHRDQDLGVTAELDGAPFGEALSNMLAWYRSRDLEKVTLATHWFVQTDIQARLGDLIDQLRSSNFVEVSDAKNALGAFSELGAKRVADLLEEPELHHHAVDILSRMDGYVLPHFLRWLDRVESFNTRIGILKALTGHLADHRAITELSTALRDPDPVVSAFVFQSLLAIGPVGHAVLGREFPTRALMVA